MTEQDIRNNALFGEIHQLVMACLDGSATATTFDSLETLVSEKPEALDLYVEYLRDSIALRYIVPSPKQGWIEAVSPALDTECSISVNQSLAAAVAAPRTPLTSTLAYLSSGWPVAYLIATVILGIGMLISMSTYVSQPQPIANQSSPSFRSVVDPAMASVGWITGMAECRWDGNGDVSCDVRLGRQFQLTSGLLEITYNTGAKVILQGPCSYTVESPMGGHLAIGKLTARVEKKAQSNSRSMPDVPLFTISTPTATVTDLGTEFSVNVIDPPSCNVQVFEGKVQCVIKSPNQNSAGVQVLTAGQTIEISGTHMRPITHSGCQPMAVLLERLRPRGFDLGYSRGFDGLELQNAAMLCFSPSLGDMGRLRLTWNDYGRRGSAWYRYKQSISEGFSTTFRFQFSYPQGVAGDGLVFVLHNAPDLDKQNVGVEGVVRNALNVCICSYQHPNDPSNAYVAVCDGAKSIGMFDLRTRYDFQNLADSRIHKVQIDYRPGSLDVRLDSVLVLHGIKVDLAHLQSGSAIDSDGKAWLGLAASTGEWSDETDKNHTEQHDVLSWAFTPRVGAVMNAPATQH